MRLCGSAVCDARIPLRCKTGFGVALIARRPHLKRALRVWGPFVGSVLGVGGHLFVVAGMISGRCSLERGMVPSGRVVCRGVAASQKRNAIREGRPLVVPHPSGHWNRCSCAFTSSSPLASFQRSSACRALTALPSQCSGKHAR